VRFILSQLGINDSNSYEYCFLFQSDSNS